MLALSSRALNSPKHLLLNENSISWSADVGDCWVLGDPTHTRSAGSLLETLSRETPCAVPDEFVRSMDGIAQGRIPWPLIVPQRVLGDHLRNLASDFEEALERAGEYAETLARSRRILSRLQPCRIDLAALRVEQGKSATGTLDSFEPGPDFTCYPPIYSHATSTGRLTVKSGPKILTLQKEHRRILTSRFDGGRMMQVDFVSLEPRVLRLLAEGSAPIDIYSDVSTRLGGAANRRQVKLATLKMLYGSGRAGITEDVGSISPKAIRGIEDYFGLPRLRASLQAQLGRDGAIKSRWGRPLPEATETHLLVSHFTQSTAVDVALGGFGDMVERFEIEDLDIVPCYVLHDALLLDVHPGSMSRLEEIAREGVDVDDLGHFEVSLSPAYIEMEAS